MVPALPLPLLLLLVLLPGAAGGCICSCCSGTSCYAPPIGDVDVCTADACRQAYPTACNAKGQVTAVASNSSACTTPLLDTPDKLLAACNSTEATCSCTQGYLWLMLNCKLLTAVTCLPIADKLATKLGCPVVCSSPSASANKVVYPARIEQFTGSECNGELLSSQDVPVMACTTVTLMGKIFHGKGGCGTDNTAYLQECTDAACASCGDFAAVTKDGTCLGVAGVPISGKATCLTGQGDSSRPGRWLSLVTVLVALVVYHDPPR